MARHASPLNRTAKRALIVLATASAALGAGVATASADAPRATDAAGLPASLGAMAPQAGTQVPGLTDYAAVPLQALQYTPVAHTRVLPVDDGDLGGLTGPLARTGPIGVVPVTEGLGGVLGGMAGMQ
ncbi:hypothetical protein [Streptomyces roseochromogenus]|uniref:Secreted protein n=1 Tax=Streptomyces roseochromogenus subsp. oscitans DS 12.976 TaxID=1352936 RepID=V6KIC7_STRRC|nr:hypothetical protein [Streptomyces roseochromogenus]EST31847.1 hypothetical protein M878_15940 [Streptomyces roseochromogenus subsp. oscitans DS 12.976]